MSGAAVAIVAAVEREVRPLIARLHLSRVTARSAGAPIYTGHYEGRAITLIATGIGAAHAARALAALLGRERWDQVLVTGLCGALDPQLPVAALIWPDEVLDAATGDTFRRPIAHEGVARLVSVDRVIASPSEKSALGARHRAAAVDMETAAIAAVCEGHGVPWICVRAVSDTAEQALPDGLETLIDAYGRLRPWPAARQLARAPGKLAALARLAHASVQAAEALAGAVPPLLAGATHDDTRRGSPAPRRGG